MKKVYTIVLFETSISAFHMEPPGYIHYGKTTFDTGLKIELLQEYCLIALDEFRKYPYPKDRSEQTAWLSLLTTEDIKEAEELLDMYSEALRILDRNTVRYMIEEQQKELEQKKEEINQQKAIIKDQQKEIEELKSQSEQLKRDNS